MCTINLQVIQRPFFDAILMLALYDIPLCPTDYNKTICTIVNAFHHLYYMLRLHEYDLILNIAMMYVQQLNMSTLQKAS